MHENVSPALRHALLLALNIAFQNLLVHHMSSVLSIEIRKANGRKEKGV